uniref:Nucleoprotein TPR n=1 Tax=Macrostomum lignano TaxID=282301 RepID=A0A1I8JE07_9PLAT
ATMELAAAANKQTIERLLAEVNKEYRAAFQLGFTEAEFKTETDKLKEENEQLTKKAELLEIQLNAEKATVETVKADLSEKEAQLSKLDCEKREATHSSETLGKQLAGFVESLATMLGTAYNRVPSTEEAVREKVRQLLADVRNHSAAMAGLEERVKTVTGQLEQQLEANRKREERGVAAEGEAKELRDKLRAVEAQLAAGDVIRESLRGDKDRLYQYLKRLGQALSMEASAIDVAYDVLGEGLVERAEQLVRQGGGCCGCDNGGGLRRRVDSLKEQLESKDLHLELMRRRLAQLDGSGAAAPSGGVADLERERRGRRSGGWRRRTGCWRMLADDLRAQLSGFGELRAAASRQDRDLEQLEAALDKLERVRQKQAQRIASLKTQLAECRRDSDESLRCLSEELRVARQELDEA